MYHVSSWERRFWLINLLKECPRNKWSYKFINELLQNSGVGWTNLCRSVGNKYKTGWKKYCLQNNIKVEFSSETRSDLHGMDCTVLLRMSAWVLNEADLCELTTSSRAASTIRKYETTDDRRNSWVTIHRLCHYQIKLRQTRSTFISLIQNALQTCSPHWSSVTLGEAETVNFKV